MLPWITKRKVPERIGNNWKPFIFFKAKDTTGCLCTTNRWGLQGQNIKPYLGKAGLAIDKLIKEPGQITQGLVLYNGILKRKLQLDDIAKGKTLT